MEDKKFQPPPFYKFKLFTRLIWETCNNQDDFILFINGPRGCGKSLAGVALVREYMETYINENYNKQCLLDHTVYEHEQLFNRAKNLPLKHPVLVDEGIRVAYTGDFATREVKEMVKFFTQCRTKNRLVIFISPNFCDINRRLREYAKYRIRMIDRRIGVLFCRDECEGVDPFHLKELQDIEKFHGPSTDINDVLARLQKHPCYVDVIDFPIVPKDIQEWYGEYRDMAVYGQVEDSVSRNDRSFQILYNIKKEWPRIYDAIEKRDHAKKKELGIPLTNRELGATRLLKWCFDPVTSGPFWASNTTLDVAFKRIEEQIEKKQKSMELSRTVVKAKTD